jgi:hypothetical protein
MKRKKPEFDIYHIGEFSKKRRSTQQKGSKQKYIQMADGSTIKRRENPKPPTEAQLQQRARWSLATNFANKVKSALSYKSWQVKTMTAHNYLVKQILSGAIIGDYPTLEINYAAVAITTGQDSNIYLETTSVGLTGICTLEWQLGNNMHGKSEDLLQVLIYNRQKNTGNFFANVCRQDTLKALIHITDYEEGDELHGWIYVISRSPKVITRSRYLGILPAENLSVI